MASDGPHLTCLGPQKDSFVVQDRIDRHLVNAKIIQLYRNISKGKWLCLFHSARNSLRG